MDSSRFDLLGLGQLVQVGSAQCHLHLVQQRLALPYRPFFVLGQRIVKIELRNDLFFIDQPEFGDLEILQGFVILAGLIKGFAFVQEIRIERIGGMEIANIDKLAIRAVALFFLSSEANLLHE